MRSLRYPMLYEPPRTQTSSSRARVPRVTKQNPARAFGWSLPARAVDEAAVPHRVHSRKHLDHFGIVADHDDGLAVVGGERLQQGRDRGSVGRIEIAGRFVGED